MQVGIRVLSERTVILMKTPHARTACGVFFNLEVSSMVSKQRTLSDMFQVSTLSFEREAQRVSKALMSSLPGSSAKRSTRK
ncbi:DUF5753 domain-containing protein [Pseudomonas serbica]|jgi:hypothetical protein